MPFRSLRAKAPSLTRDRAREIWPDRWVVDGSKFARLTGWRASTSSERGSAGRAKLLCARGKALVGRLPAECGSVLVATMLLALAGIGALVLSTTSATCFAAAETTDD